MIYLISIILLANARTSTSTIKSQGKSGANNEYIALAFGVCIFVFALVLLWINERRHLVSQKSIHAAEHECRTNDPLEVNANSNNKLIHVIGLAQSDAVVQDPLFNIKETNTIKIERLVEMYQWFETSTDDDYQSYSKKWSSKLIDTKSLDHTNQLSSQSVRQEKFLNPSVKLGSYNLSDSLKSQSIANIPIYPTSDQANLIKEHPEHSKHNYVVQMGGYIYLQQGQQLQVGDLRVKFFKAPCGTQTVISQQNGMTFQPYLIHISSTSNQSVGNKGCWNKLTNIESPIKEIDWIFEGRVSVVKAFRLKLWPELKYTYLARAVSWLALWLGMFLIFLDISDYLNWIKMIDNQYPKIGWCVYLVVTLILSIPLRFVGMSCVRIYYRPIQGIFHFAISGAVFVAVCILLIYA